MIKTHFDSYLINNLPRGCQYCVAGRKLVLFITGKCTRACVYCPLSDKRKNSQLTWANEKECFTIDEVIQEVIKSNAKGAGITGGDPLEELNKTIKYASALKKKFGKKFHIHIYLSTHKLKENSLKKLSKCVDEIRFHPMFVSRILRNSRPGKFGQTSPSKKTTEKENLEDIRKISQASKYFKKENLGIEVPLIPEKKKEILSFIKKASKYISFVNLNEYEIGDTNFRYMTMKYNFNKTGYTVKKSIEAGKWILKKLEGTPRRREGGREGLDAQKTKLNVHLCTADTKNWHQYKNRLRNYQILPFGKKTQDGTVIYFTAEIKNKKLLKKTDFYDDRPKSRLILNPKTIKKFIGRFKILKVEEYPTSDRDEVEVGELTSNN